MTLYPDGKIGETVQFAIVPVVTGVWLMVWSMVSTMTPGEKDRVGLARSTLRFSVAAADPVLLDAVMA